MTFTRAIALVCNKLLLLIVRGFALSKIHPNVLTFIGLVINVYAAVLLASGRFLAAALVIIGAGIFDMVDGRVARATNQVTRFGAFFDSVLDRYSDLALLMGLLVYYGNINRSFYVVLTAVVMTTSVMISYTRSRAENVIPLCKVGFLERPERVVLLIIGGLFDRMAPVLWVIAGLGTITVIHRMMFTFTAAKQLDDVRQPTA
jgi:CDP-diacylglycerol---glycerol-3-phosphate 3-phosphatidyltransferase